MTRLLLALVLLTAPATALAQTFPAPREAGFVARNVRFDSGDLLPEVKIHYRTIGEPRKDADGVVRNGVLILHGTGGTGRAFLSESYGGRLFGPGQTARRRAVLHHPAGQHRARAVEQTERRAAR